MKLIIGGYAQGKLNYAVTKYNVAEDHVFESVLPTSEELEKLTGTIVVTSLHKWIRKRIKEGGRPEEEISSFVKKNPDCIIICDEIGNGIVPMDPFERVYRERTGRIQVKLANDAEEVERVVCGIAQKIK
ncbi:MAG: bifunctional adenosylcobinamide kinase/adenosylcobinamide-phosphate guanylyltransferase [Lachnospiraceae bacterium]|nr:bifunctional adenosylcobinamide kinase/adenosylcobinamide-phosphate guanylyltransferase [Lachnospiraceae bacterium]MBR5917574.1 bifunctional adenosylcobinamide kinase/adenosylcobinamide-phosphate guanylyltransferase [Lachnospiraceae bacterium]